MSGPLVKYETAPALIFNYPSCSACLVETVSEDGNWECPRCGTLWGQNQFDEPGQLYEEWSGGEAAGEPRTHDDGHKPTRYELDNPAPSVWGDFGKQLSAALFGGTQ